MHNLFGDTNAVHISMKDGTYHIDQVFDGETVEEVLDYVQYNPKKLVRQLEIWVTKSVKQGKISLEEGKEFLSNYRSGLYGYTFWNKLRVKGLEVRAGKMPDNYSCRNRNVE